MLFRLSRRRALIAVLGSATTLAILLAIYYLWNSSTRTILKTAEGQFGESHFLLKSGDRAVGSLRTRSHRAPTGQFVFEQRHSYPISPTVMFQIEIEYRFESEPPHQLATADFRQSVSNDEDAELSLKLAYYSDGLQFSPAGTNAEPLDTEFGLADFLELEHRLRVDNPSVGDEITRTSIDWDKRSLDTSKWHILGISKSAYQIESADGNVISKYSRIPKVGLIQSIDFESERSLESTSEVDLEAISRKTFALGGFIPVEGSITDPRTIAELTLRFDFDGRTPVAWREILDKNNHLTIQSQAEHGTLTVVPDQSLDNLDATPELKSLNETVARIGEIDSAGEKSRSLLAFVNDYVQYVELDAPQKLQTTIHSKRGDCSDIAELYTALANKLGIPTRTVVGLVYDSVNDSFRVHAWNEVEIDGQLRQLDPTWSQYQADATHIEFPQGREFEILGALSELTIKVVDQSQPAS